ncbi:MAG: SDR family NAD(P)-dependent oxidoreductase [Kordiimonadaceae bacterium]|jgi:NAD(P)-dependent dehydrogenase (short-subunit alcohol dehydrogenase family)|nr:SDR family NAD(P)-dependent oxidoreductase [Kordiimonadaceae bacterium]MBT6035847.1 SDR family NAD(P)-dependent oxidoreductase [Kordiimonadaceae bacterium]MBT6329619.1 SDR family NAD(P)-dependent oxidoreductase [Kordiimonadaceae bacterium]MBT7582481.1 SDR family NAD(P)-dependent oxidoreductase [Kordiimonadaceae bacterium]
MTINLTGQVAIVTGAGAGLGRAYAMALAERGASVIVNDLSGAETVVQQIIESGGTAIANDGNVTSPEDMMRMADQAMEEYGRIDILVSNAGILRDKTFAKLALDDFKAVIDVHLMGSINATKAVLPAMQQANYGRIIMVSSSSGVYGNFGQSNYGAAKMGIVGLMNTLKLELSKNNIHVNTLVPIAATQMTEDLMPAEALATLKPELVSPAVIFMSANDAPNGEIISAGAGSFSRIRVVESEGVYLGENASAEMITENWSEITNPLGERSLTSGPEHSLKFVSKAITPQ